MLRLFVEQGSQEAFTQLMHRHLALVYSVCRRETGDPTLAQDVTQAVFLLLAQKAASIKSGTLLSGWLFKTARFAARNALRQEARRKKGEQEVIAEMVQRTGGEDTWGAIESLLHSGIDALPRKEREAVLLHYFEGQGFKEAGRVIGITEDAARLRTSRAVEQLKLYLKKHGVVVSAAILATLLSERTVMAMPSGCEAAIAQVAAHVTGGASTMKTTFACSKADAISKGVLKSMLLNKIQAGAIALTLTAVGTKISTTVGRGSTAAPKFTFRRVSISPQTVLAAETALTQDKTPKYKSVTLVSGGAAKPSMALKEFKGNPNARAVKIISRGEGTLATEAPEGQTAAAVFASHRTVKGKERTLSGKMTFVVGKGDAGAVATPSFNKAVGEIAHIKAPQPLSVRDVAGKLAAGKPGAGAFIGIDYEEPTSKQDEAPKYKNITFVGRGANKSTIVLKALQGELYVRGGKIIPRGEGTIEIGAPAGNTSFSFSASNTVMDTSKHLETLSGKIKIVVGTGTAGAIEITSVDEAVVKMRYIEDPQILNGTACDETGKPVADALIGADYDEPAIKTDAEGRFSLPNLEAGEVTLFAGAGWLVVKPAKTTAPSVQPIVVTLRKVIMAPLRGRVVGDKGAPVENAEVTASWSAPQNAEGGLTSREKRVLTGADGRYEITGIPAESQVSVTAAKPGCRLVQGLEPLTVGTIIGVNGAIVLSPNPVFKAGDMVLLPLEREAVGRVVDAAGQPVANALVAALVPFQGTAKQGATQYVTRTDAEGRFRIGDLPDAAKQGVAQYVTRTDAGGRFRIGNLPDKEIAFVAGNGDGFAELRSQKSAVGDLVLKPQKRLTQDLPRARQILLMAATEIPANDNTTTAWLPLALAPYDYIGGRDAVNATRLNNERKASMKWALVAYWIARDPEEARAALPELLPELEGKIQNYWFPPLVFEMAHLLPQPEKITVEGEAAETAAIRAWVWKQFSAMRDTMAAVTVDTSADRQVASRFAALAVLGQRLGETEAEKWAKAAVQIAVRCDTANNISQTVGTVGRTLAAGGSGLVEKVLGELTPEQRMTLLTYAVPQVAHVDIKGAKRLMDSFPQETQSQRLSFSSFSTAMIADMKEEDAAEALALAQRVTWKYERPKALVLAARLQPKEQAQALFREAFNMVSNGTMDPIEPGIFAGLARQIDPALGDDLLAKTEESFFTGPNAGITEIPTFYLAQSQPGRARAWIEWKWARALVEPAQPGDWNRGRDRGKIAVAMSAVDIDRALEMAEAIPPSINEDGTEDREASMQAASQIVAFLAAPENERRNIPVSYWDSGGDAWTREQRLPIEAF